VKNVHEQRICDPQRAPNIACKLLRIDEISGAVFRVFAVVMVAAVLVNLIHLVNESPCRMLISGLFDLLDHAAQSFLGAE
jgi:hypothetical protein